MQESYNNYDLQKADPMSEEQLLVWRDVIEENTLYDSITQVLALNWETQGT
jgi:hypothetical protein